MLRKVSVLAFLSGCLIVASATAPHQAYASNGICLQTCEVLYESCRSGCNGNPECVGNCDIAYNVCVANCQD